MTALIVAIPLAALVSGYAAYRVGIKYGRIQGEKLGREKVIEENKRAALEIKEQFK